jgi:uncharacterized protein YqgC (DUF456 family)
LVAVAVNRAVTDQRVVEEAHHLLPVLSARLVVVGVALGLVGLVYPVVPVVDMVWVAPLELVLPVRDTPVIALVVELVGLVVLAVRDGLLQLLVQQ